MISRNWPHQTSSHDIDPELCVPRDRHYEFRRPSHASEFSLGVFELSVNFGCRPLHLTPNSMLVLFVARKVELQ